MLYTKIRYAETIRKLYRLKHVLAHSRHPEIGSRLGYQKYSKQFYIILSKLKDEGILDKEGRFVESITNKWLSELPIMIKDRKELQILGFAPTLKIYLALLITKDISIYQIVNGLQMSERTAYAALKKLEGSSLIEYKKNWISINEEKEFARWLSKYLDLSITQADTENNISILFDSVPGYIDGPQAYYLTNYEPGRPIGPADMIIRTNRLYESFWEYVKNKVRYFQKFPKKIIILESTTDAEIIWVNNLPYNKNVREDDF